MKRLAMLMLALLLCAPTSASAFAAQDDQAKLVAGNTEFAFDLYAAIRADADGNLVFSPYSISQVLAMVYAGARGETADQMAATLSFALPPNALDKTFGDLNGDLVKRGNAEADPDNYVNARGLRIANALWGEQSYPFDPAYSARLAEAYGAGLQQTDFKNAPEQARGEINDWVSKQTNDRIQNIVPPDQITPDTRLVLANAIWFSGGWYFPFDPDSTNDGAFHLLDGSTVTVPFMYQDAHFEYARGDGYQALEFPYAGDGSETSGFTFTVILPDAGTFEAFEQGLDAATLDSALGQLSYTEVKVYLPKFDFAFDTDLAPTLAAMGMTDAFDPNKADFTGMVKGTPPEPLYIGAVLHKANITVDENGTEAAAATVVEMAAGAAPPAQVPPVVRVDRPFVFAIRDSKTGALLFLGRVMNPSG